MGGTFAETFLMQIVYALRPCGRPRSLPPFPSLVPQSSYGVWRNASKLQQRLYAELACQIHFGALRDKRTLVAVFNEP